MLTVPRQFRRLSLFNSHLSFWCPGKAVLRDYIISWVSSLNFKVLGCIAKLFTFGLSAEKRDLIAYANNEDPDQPAHQRSLVTIFVVRLHNIGTWLMR